MSRIPTKEELAAEELYDFQRFEYRKSVVRRALVECPSQDAQDLLRDFDCRRAMDDERGITPSFLNLCLRVVRLSTPSKPETATQEPTRE